MGHGLTNGWRWKNHNGSILGLSEVNTWIISNKGNLTRGINNIYQNQMKKFKVLVLGRALSFEDSYGPNIQKNIKKAQSSIIMPQSSEEW